MKVKVLTLSPEGFKTLFSSCYLLSPLVVCVALILNFSLKKKKKDEF